MYEFILCITCYWDFENTYPDRSFLFFLFSQLDILDALLRSRRDPGRELGPLGRDLCPARPTPPEEAVLFAELVGVSFVFFLGLPNMVVVDLVEVTWSNY